MQLRTYQREAINSVYDYFAKQSGHPLLVLPTAAGKGVIQAFFQREALTNWPDQRILNLTHVKELIEQNHEKVTEVWPEGDAGIYCASLNRKERFNQMIFGSIQSVHKKARDLGRFDLVIVDEAHLVPATADTMYRRFLDDLIDMNDKVKVIGMSATPFRLDSGFLHTGDDALFTDICYNLPIIRLINEGWLAPLVSKAGIEKMNTDAMRKARGDFKTSDMVDEATRIMRGACTEIVDYGQNRNAWLIFCPGVAYAEQVAAHLRDHYGLTGDCLHGGTPKSERAEMIAAFKDGRLKFLTNCDVLTTGFDAPIVDMIAFLRPTQSPALYIQMCGRGMRLSPETGKQDCLVLDFAGNVKRHGPVDTINIVDKILGEKGEVELEGTAPTKECPNCMAIVSAMARICPFCMYVWPPKHTETADTQAILSTLAKPEWHEVDAISYQRHKKPDKPDSVRVTYRSGVKFFDEWVCCDHERFAKDQAIKWLMKRGVPMHDAQTATVNDVLGQAVLIKAPSKVSVRSEGKYDRIVDVEFGENSPEIIMNDSGVPDFSQLIKGSGFTLKQPEPPVELDDDEIPF